MSTLISCLCIRVLCALTNITGIIITMILNPQASHTREWWVFFLWKHTVARGTHLNTQYFPLIGQIKDRVTALFSDRRQTYKRRRRQKLTGNCWTGQITTCRESVHARETVPCSRRSPIHRWATPSRRQSCRACVGGEAHTTQHGVFRRPWLATANRKWSRPALLTAESDRPLRRWL